ncbi:MAG: ComF family protein [Parcubacteria group bacterium]|nr:ComF family protein [Parcubacteria group bacterium]
MSFALIHTTLRAVLATFFPDRCVGCQKSGTILCAVCRGQLHPCSASCVGCDVAQFDDSSLCKRCARREHIPLNKLFVVFSYRTPVVRASIHAFKYRNIRRLAPILAAGAEKFAPSLQKTLGKETALVAPIPLSRRRLRKRGFNQSALIASEFSKFLALPLDANLLKKIIETKPQVETANKKERLANVRGALFSPPARPWRKRRARSSTPELRVSSASLWQKDKKAGKIGRQRRRGCLSAEGGNGNPKPRCKNSFSLYWRRG